MVNLAGERGAPGANRRKASTSRDDGFAAQLQMLRGEIGGLARQLQGLQSQLSESQFDRGSTELALAHVAKLEERLGDLALVKELHQVREMLASVSLKLAEAETANYRLSDENARLRGSGATVGGLASELNIVRARMEQAEARLARLRSSVSWRMTIPVRWIGRVWKGLAKRGAK